MSKAETSKRRKRAPGAGRPALPPGKRADRRITVRLYAEDEALMIALCEALGMSEAEVMRHGLQELARRYLPSAQ